MTTIVKYYPAMSVKGKNVRRHIVVGTEKYGKIPKGCVVHHKDMDKNNYDIDNFELMSRKDHQRTHRGWKKTSGAWSHKPCGHCEKLLELSNYSKRKATCKNCQKKLIKKWRSENKAHIKEYRYNYRNREVKNGKPNNKNIEQKGRRKD